MNSYQEALKKYQSAKYILETTYPLVNDPKLLLSSLRDMKESLEIGLKIQNILVPNKYIQLYEELSQILNLHKKGPMEFRKCDKYVICDEKYELTTITKEKAEEFLNILNEFLLFISRKE